MYRTTRAFTRVLIAACAVAVAACSGGDSTAPTPANPTPVDTTPKAVATIALSPTTRTLFVGDSTQLQAVARDAESNALPGRGMAWSSNGVAIARVNSSGVVTAVSPGVANIVVASEGRTAQAIITVQAPPPVLAPVMSVAVTTALDTIEAYDVVTMQAVLRDSVNNVLAHRTVRWASSNTAVASIDNVTGVLTGIDRGTVTITATSEGKAGTASRVVVIRYRSLTTATAHACNLASGGIAWCWGLNGTQGRIGSPDMADQALSSTPVQVPGNHRFSQIASFGRTTCGVRLDAKMFCWGSNNWGALGVATTVAQSSTPVEVTGGRLFRSVTAGGDQICALTVDFRAYCWGNNAWGQFGSGNTSSNAVPQAAGNGAIYSSISAGNEFTCAITVAGTGFCWGADGLGQHGNGLALSQGNTFNTAPRTMVGPALAAISVSNQLGCGLTFTGDAYCWGSSTGGRLGSAGNSTSTPRAVSGGLNFRNISAGAVHVCGVTQDYEVYCWGMNGNGQLGQTLTNGSVTPIRAGGNLLAAEVSAANISTGSAAYTCAESKDRLTTYCWGRNDLGQLGNGTTANAVAVNSAPSIVIGQKPL